MPSTGYANMQQRIAAVLAESGEKRDATQSDVTSAFLSTAAESCVIQKLSKEDFIMLAGEFYDTAQRELAAQGVTSP